MAGAERVEGEGVLVAWFLGNYVFSVVFKLLGTCSVATGTFGEVEVVRVDRIGQDNLGMACQRIQDLLS